MIKRGKTNRAEDKKELREMMDEVYDDTVKTEVAEEGHESEKDELEKDELEKEELEKDELEKEELEKEELEKDELEKEEDSNNDDFKSTRKKKSKNKANKMAWIVRIASLLILVGLVVVIAISSKQGSNKEDISTEFKVGTNAKTILNKIDTAVDKLYTDNAYMVMHVGEADTDVVYMMYNKDKEAYCESASNDVVFAYTKDNKCIIFTDPIEINYELDQIALVKKAEELVRFGYGEAEQEESEIEGIEQYAITVTGKHNVRKMFSSIDRDYADYEMEAIYGARYDKEKYTDDYVDEKDTDNIKLSVHIGSNGEVGIECTFNIDNTEYTSWWFDGYIPLKEWKLPDKFYKLNTENTEDWKEPIKDLQTEIQSLVAEYTESVSDETESEEATEGKEDETKEGTESGETTGNEQIEILDTDSDELKRIKEKYNNNEKLTVDEAAKLFEIQETQ